MKKPISIFLVLCFVLCLCSCGKNEPEADKTEKNAISVAENSTSTVKTDENSTAEPSTSESTTSETVSAENADNKTTAADNNGTTSVKTTTAKSTTKKSIKSNVKTVINEKAAKIEKSLGTVSINEVFDDISSINLYFKPDFGNKQYTVETVEDTENGTKDINYYSGKTLVYTKYEGYGEEGFAHYTKTASGLKATVKYYTDSGDNRTVGIETPKYSVFANSLNKKDPYGLGDTNIVLVSDKLKAPFKGSVCYQYDNGKAVFDNASYVENGNYQRYSFYIDEEGKEVEYTDVMVYGKAPKTSDDIIKVLTSDKSYKFAAIEIDGSNKWYCSDDKWYVNTTLAIVMDSKKKAEEYIKKNNLKGTVDDYGSIVVRIDNVTLPINKNALLDNGNLPDYIAGEIDESYFEKISLDSSGVIKKLTPASIAIY